MYTRDGVVALGGDSDVFIDLGIADGVQPGDQFSIFRYAAGTDYGIRPQGSYWVYSPPPPGVEIPRTYLGDMAILYVGDRWAMARIIDAQPFDRGRGPGRAEVVRQRSRMNSEEAPGASSFFRFAEPSTECARGSEDGETRLARKSFDLATRDGTATSRRAHYPFGFSFAKMRPSSCFAVEFVGEGQRESGRAAPGNHR